jgi:hypothetical protein
MILNAFPLYRDRCTEKDSFGYTRQAWGRAGQVFPFVPTLGCPIEIATTLRPNIVKMVEFYNRRCGPVVVERLCWMFGKSIYPYKARYIHLADENRDVDILFLRNLKTIHGQLTGNDVTFSSPIKYHLETFVPSWRHQYKEDSPHRTLAYFHRKYVEWIDGFAYAQDDWEDARKFVESIDNGNSTVCDEDYFAHFVLAKPTIHDPFSLNNHSRPLRAGGLAFEKPSGNPFDTTRPEPLSIPRPERTLFSPKSGHNAIVLFDQIALQYTDVNLEYILSGTAVVSIKENYRVSRYRNELVRNPDLDCKWVIVNDILPMVFSINRDYRVTGDIRVNFILTYGEEVLVEVIDLHTNDYLGAVHFDLAMLALCAPNIAAC